MIARRMLAVSAVCAAAAVAALMIGGAVNRGHRATIKSSDQAVLEVLETPPVAGELVIKAKATLQLPYLDTNLWWYVDVRRIDPVMGSMSTVWRKSTITSGSTCPPASGRPRSFRSGS